jgi:hypothetical protein
VEVDHPPALRFGCLPSSATLDCEIIGWVSREREWLAREMGRKNINGEPSRSIHIHVIFIFILLYSLSIFETTLLSLVLFNTGILIGIGNIICIILIWMWVDVDGMDMDGGM